MTDGVIDMTNDEVLNYIEGSWDGRFLDAVEEIIVRRPQPKGMFFRLLDVFKVGEELNAEEWKALERAVTPKHNHHKAH
jgi:hypothetical protein